MSNKEFYELKKEIEREEKKIKNKIGKIELEVTQCELKLKELEAEMAKPENYEEQSKMKELLKNYDEVKDQLTNHMDIWEIYTDELTAHQKKKEASL